MASKSDAGSGAEFDRAVDWLLNSRYMDSEAETHFWHIADGRDGTCEWCTDELRGTTWGRK
jgi:hypothetical protein